MSATIFCPRAKHKIEWSGALFDTDLVPCEECGPDEFIRVRFTMETIAEPLTEPDGSSPAAKGQTSR